MGVWEGSPWLWEQSLFAASVMQRRGSVARSGVPAWAPFTVDRNDPLYLIDRIIWSALAGIADPA